MRPCCLETTLAGVLHAWLSGHAMSPYSRFVHQLLQAPLAYAGVSFSNRRPYKILEDMSGVLQPVSMSHGYLSILLCPSLSSEHSIYLTCSTQCFVQVMTYL
jgi:hypothetical protein